MEQGQELHKTLAMAQVARDVVANPMMANGRKIPGLKRSPQQLQERAEDSAYFYASLSPELRAEALKQAQEKSSRLTDSKRDNNKREELDAVIDGLALVAAANDEPLTVKGHIIRPDPSPEFRALAKGMIEQKSVGSLLGTVREFHSPESRDVIKGSLKGLEKEDIYKVAGGKDGPYGAIIKAMESGDLSPEKMALARSWLEGMTIDNMTVGESVLAAAATNAGGDKPDQVQKILEGAREKVRKDPKVKSALDQLMACLKKAAGDEKTSVRCRKEFRFCKITQLAATVNAAEESAGNKLDPGHPTLAQLRLVIETGNLDELEKRWVREGVSK